MADVRSMLRLEREKRKITHPHASYTTDGKLICNLCETLVKSDTAWQSHLHSSQHTLRLNRSRDAAATRGANGGSRKRKASDLESPAPEERKKAKADAPSSPLEEKDDLVEENNEKKVHFAEATTEGGPAQLSEEVEDEVDEAQLEAFDRELAEMEAEMRSTSEIQTAPTITAAPMTAAEVAAQAREEQSAQRGKRDAELEAEKEDAARLLEDEFEQMEGFEERVKKLRERREALRTQTESKPVNGVIDGEQRAGFEDDDQALKEANPSMLSAGGPEANVGADDEEDEDSDDDWNFGAQ